MTDVYTELLQENSELKTKVFRLEQENKELKETIKQYCQWLDEEREDNDKLQKVYQNDHCDLLNYRSALEEIRTYLNTLSSIDSDFTNTETYLRIQNKINEVLNES